MESWDRPFPIASVGGRDSSLPTLELLVDSPSLVLRLASPLGGGKVNRASRDKGLVGRGGGGGLPCAVGNAFPSFLDLLSMPGCVRWGLFEEGFDGAADESEEDLPPFRRSTGSLRGAVCPSD